jgi:hypothetical protein
MLAAPAGKTLFKHAAPEHRMPMPQAGKTPGIVFSGPDGEQHLLAFERQGLAKLVAKLGRTGWAVSLFDLQIRSEDGSSTAVRALVSHQSRVLRFPLHRPLHFLTLLPRRPAQAAPCPAAASFAAAVPPLQGRQVHMTADTDAIENVTLIECPADRPVRVEVPLKVRAGSGGRLALVHPSGCLALCCCLCQAAADRRARPHAGLGRHSHRQHGTAALPHMPAFFAPCR